MSLKTTVKNLLRRQPNWLTVSNRAEAAEMVIDGPIGKSWYDDSGVSAKEFENALNAIPKGKPVNVHINSEGGAIGDGLKIFNLLQARKADVTCYVEGYALSSASFIALGGGRTIAPKSSIMMAHLPWTMTAGDEEDHAKAAEMLKTHGDVIAGIYADKTGKPKAEMLDLMKKETWLGGAEAVSLGFADATSASAACPKCGHEQCSECEQEDSSITCSECGETSSSTDWDSDSDAENAAKTRVSALGSRLKDHEKGLYNERIQELYQNVPANIFNMLRPGQTARAALDHATTTTTTTATSSAAPLGSGVAGTAASNSETANQMSKENEKTPVAAATTAAPVNASELAEIRAELQRERKLRIEAKVDTFIGECRMTNDERADAVNRALADESYLGIIGKRPAMNAGGKPLGVGVVAEVMDDVFVSIKKERSPVTRNNLRKNDWEKLYLHAKSVDARGAGARGVNDLINLPVNANSVASALVVDFLADAAITQLVNVLPSLRAFTRDFTSNPMAPLNTVQVRLVTQGGQDQQASKANVSVTGAITNYETGDHTVSAVAITMQEFSEALNLTSQELLSGMRIEQMANHALLSLGTDLVNTALTPLLTSTFTAGNTTGTVAAHYGTWNWNVSGAAAMDMATLRAALGKSTIKSAILTPTFFSKLITIPIGSSFQKDLGLGSNTSFQNIFGWNEVAESSAWPTGTGVESTSGNICGFACNPQAIAVAARLPLLPPEGVPGNTLVSSSVLIPGLDLSVMVYQWFNLQTRTLWNSFGLVFGAKAGDLTAGCVLKTWGA